MLGEVAQSNLWQNDREIQQRLESEVELILLLKVVKSVLLRYPLAPVVA